MDRSQIISPKTEYDIGGWVTAPSSLYLNDEALISIVQMLLNLVGSDRVFVRSSEPCLYRTTAQGLAALADALHNRCIRFLEFDTDQFMSSGKRYSPAAVPSAEMVLQLPPHGAATIGITLGFPSRLDMLSGTNELVEFIQASFISTAAIYGCLSSATASISPEESIIRNTEAQEFPPWPVRRSAVSRFPRGVFWGNALGEEICERLGGQKRVLAEAPVQIREPLGAGVWLQVSSMPPASNYDIDDLARYLTPVLDWMEDDSQKAFPQSLPDHEPRGVLPWIPLLLNWTAADSTISAITKSFDIPIRRLEHELEYGFVVNIHLAETPTKMQRESIITALVKWYGDVESDSGMRVFRDVRDLIINNKVIRWSAEVREINLDDILRRLRDELAAVNDIEIVEVVVGTEIVG